MIHSDASFSGEFTKVEYISIRMLAEAKRVCRPGGKIVIVNHFTTDLPIIGPLTEALDPVTRRLGWRTKLRLEPFLKATDFNVEEVYKISKLSLYTVVVGANRKESLTGSRLSTNGSF